MHGAAPLVLALAAAQESEPLRWRVLSPLDSSDVAALSGWWREKEGAIGAGAEVGRALALGAEELQPDTLLLGFERGFLDELMDEGSLAAPPVTFALESWIPAWSAGGEEMPELDSFEKLLDPALRGRVHLRLVTADSPEGLVLGDVARRLGLLDDERLVRLVLASYQAGTIHAATGSLDALLAALPPGVATIAPVRAAVRARRAGARVSFGRPREGCLALELAAAPTQGTSAALLRWWSERFERAVAPALVQALELEPPGPLAETAPEWQRFAAGARAAIDRDGAGRLRIRLARLYEASPPESALPRKEAWLDFVDTLLLTAVVIAVLAFWLRERRRGTS